MSATMPAHNTSIEKAKPMNTNFSDTETVVRHHLQSFVEQQGLDAILNDYADEACFLSEGRAYCGKSAIREFFTDFIAALPPQAIGQFTLRSLRVQGEVAYITWSAGSDLPLGTDTFVVREGRIVAQTFAMYAAPAN
jgi:ketosteroid isomerase-like protein